MKTSRLWIIALMGAFGLVLPAQALAQVPEDSDPEEEVDEPASEPKESDELPTPVSDEDPTPPAATVDLPPGGIVRQAGVGGPVAYARRGVLELGGAAGLTAASDFTQVFFRPSIGWFVFDNVELSALVGLHHSEAGDESSTLFTALVEPSFHLPFNSTMFGFVGMGMGLGYVEGPGAGLALAPRLGANFLVGRSGLLTPAIGLQYTTHEATQTPQGTLLAVSTSFGFEIGYTVMW
jgi:hypothetical protein